MKPKILNTLLFLLVCFALFNSKVAFTQEKVEIYFFYSETCPYCAKEKEFLKELKIKYPQLEIKEYEVFRHPENQKILNEFYSKYNVPEKYRGGVPVTFTPTDYFVGFNENIAKNIETCIKECLTIKPKDKPTKKLFLPIFGEIEIAKFSLPVLAVIFGVVDGFDLCSLAAFILVLSIVLTFRSKFKILFYGIIFILINALTYAILMLFWWKFFNLLGIYLRKMEILIAILSFGGGVYFLRRFFKFKKTAPVCEVEMGWGKEIFKKGTEKIKELFKKEKALYIILGLLIFDFIISFVEFPCSGVLPVIFTGILSEAKVSTLEYFLYLLIFLFFYLLDEIIVVFLAGLTMKIWLSSPKFITFFQLFVAILLFLLGFYYLFGLV